MINTPVKPIYNVFTRTRLPLFSILLTLTAFAISANAVPPLATTIARQFNISYDVFGYIVTLQFVCFAAASLLGGYVQHQFGFPNHTLVVAGVFGMALLLIIGSGLSSFGWVLIWVIPLGFAGGLTETFSSIMVAECEDGDSSKLINLSQVFYCAGAILAPQLVAILMDLKISWRIAFLLFGTFVTFIGCFFGLVNRHVSTPAHPISPSTPHVTKEGSNISLHRDTIFYCMALLLFLYVVIEVSSTSWIAAYFEKRFALSVSAAARRLSIFWTGIIIGRSLMVVLPARFSLWPGLIGGTSGMVLGNTLLSLSSSTGAATGAVFIYGIAAGPIWPVTVMLSQQSRDSNRFTSGVIGAGGLGAAIGPLLGSYIIRSFGLAWFFPLLAIGSVVLFSITLITKHRLMQP